MRRGSPSLASPLYTDHRSGKILPYISCNFHPLGWLWASALTCRLISLVGVKWSCLRIDKQAFPLH